MLFRRGREIGKITILAVGFFLVYTFVDIRWLFLGFISSDPLPNDGLLSPTTLRQIRPPLGKGCLRVSSKNPYYFSDADGKSVYLTGSHTWANLFDIGKGDPPPGFDYRTFLKFLGDHNHNFFRLYVWEQTRWCLSLADSNYWFYPQTPFRRTGPGTALDGKLRFNLDSLDQAYFDRLRSRVHEAGSQGIYVSIMLFNGWSVSDTKGKSKANNPWKGHPFNRANNVNGIDGDLNEDDSGVETHELGNPAITGIQESYIRRIVEAVNDLDNVLYEISNESHAGSRDWQYHMISFIKEFELTRPKQHPVGMTSEFPEGDNRMLFNSPADWISPNEWGEDGKPEKLTRIIRRITFKSNELEQYKFSPPITAGRKVIVLDTDHLWGVGGDRQWVWKSFTRATNPIFMDPYIGGVFGFNFDSLETQFESARLNMGYTLTYSQRIDLGSVQPREDLVNTTFCLANPNGPRAAYLVYRPNPTGLIKVDLRKTKRTLKVEWFDPARALVYTGQVTSGGTIQSFQSPFEGDAVLYLYSSEASFQSKPE